MIALGWSTVLLGTFILAAVLIFIARDWIRARFRRNMPSEGFGGDTKGWPPPPRPWPAPPPAQCPVHGELIDGPPCRECERAKLEKRERSFKEFGDSIQRMSSVLSHGTCHGRRWRKTTASSGPRYACGDQDSDIPALHSGIFENGQACPGCGRIINATEADGLSPKDRAQLVESVAWGLLQRHAPDLTPAEAFEKAEAWQKIMEKREAVLAEGRDPGATGPDRGWIDRPPFAAPPTLKERCAVHGIFFPVGRRCPECAAREAKGKPGIAHRCPVHEEFYLPGEECPGCASDQAGTSSAGDQSAP